MPYFKTTETGLNILGDIESGIFYMILAFVPSAYILALARTSKKMYEMIFLNNEAMQYDFSQKVYIERWLTLLSRNVDYTLDLEYFGDSMSLFATFEHKCYTLLSDQLFRLGRSVFLNCQQLPRFLTMYQDFEGIRTRPNHRCLEPYCECPSELFVNIECDCISCNDVDPTQKKILEEIVENGCPYCASSFTLSTYVPESTYCDICGCDCDTDFIYSYSCAGCRLHIDNSEIDYYCYVCWNSYPSTRKHQILVEQNYDSKKMNRSSFDFLKVTLSNSAKKEFAVQPYLKKLFEDDDEFYRLNRWWRFVCKILD